jgi:hypothetical protein
MDDRATMPSIGTIFIFRTPPDSCEFSMDPLRAVYVATHKLAIANLTWFIAVFAIVRLFVTV